MRWERVVATAILGLAASGLAFASDPQPASNPEANFAADSKMILSATGNRDRFANEGEGHACFLMRTYRVRKNMDRGSAIPTAPNQTAFNPDDIVGYSTCQKAEKFAVKSTH